MRGYRESGQNRDPVLQSKARVQIEKQIRRVGCSGQVICGTVSGDMQQFADHSYLVVFSSWVFVINVCALSLPRDSRFKVEFAFPLWRSKSNSLPPSHGSPTIYSRIMVNPSKAKR